MSKQQNKNKEIVMDSKKQANFDMTLDEEVLKKFKQVFEYLNPNLKLKRNLTPKELGDVIFASAAILHDISTLKPKEYKNYMFRDTCLFTVTQGESGETDI